MTKTMQMEEMAQKMFNGLAEKLDKLEDIPTFYYTKEEKEEVKRIYRKNDRMLNNVISVGDLENDRLATSMGLSEVGMKLAEEIMQRRA